MQYSKFAVIAALAAPLASAQSLAGLPTCAETAAISALGSTGCSLTDIACICKNSGFLSSLQPQVAAACSPSDLAAALKFAATLCASAGVTLDIPGATPAPSATPSPAPVTTSAAPTTTPMAPETAETPMPTVTEAAVVTTLMTTSMASVMTTMAPVSEFTDGQPQVPTNATTIAAPTVTPFMGAATANTAQGAIVGLLAAVGLFVAL